MLNSITLYGVSYFEIAEMEGVLAFYAYLLDVQFDVPVFRSKK